MAYTVDTAVGGALKHLERVSLHLRKHNQDNAANKIGKLSILIVQAVEEGMAHIPLGGNVIDVVVRAVCMLSITLGTKLQQAVVALMNEVNKGQKEPAAIDSRAVLKLPTSVGPVVQPGNWAQVARSLTPGPSGEASQLLSPVSLTSCSGPKAGENSIGEPATLLPASPEIPEEKAGVIRIHRVLRIHESKPKNMIEHITTRIHEGPLQDIRVESNERTRVVFQHLSDALRFLKSDEGMVSLSGYGRMGSGFRTELAEIVDWNDDLRLMNQPIRERRRLSFARKRLFADGMTHEKWKQDVYAIAGAGNVDFTLVFNAGNATAVFTSTIVARKVLETFNKWKAYRSGYSGVSVTYSSDPCEKELIRLKENHRPSYPRYNQARKVMR
ncbi:hypothetical protein BJX76DRAFT_349969 [Aspergillus varians]